MARTTDRPTQPTGDEGMALIVVIAMSAVISTLLVAAFAITRGSIQSSISHVSFEQAVNVAESGIDQTLSQLQEAYDVGYDFPVPAPGHPTCQSALVNSPSFPTEADERAWARTQLQQLQTSNDTCTQSTDEGEYVVLKPTNRQIVYSLGASPRFGDPRAKQRLLKTEYLFSPYSPSNAVLTGADLCISGSVLIDMTSTLPANVHTNADVSTTCGGGGGVGSGSSTIEGTLTASGDYTVNPNLSAASGSGGGVPKQGVSAVDASKLYQAQVSKYPGKWFDLCADGTMRRGTSLGPCQATGADVLYSHADSPLGYQGWTFTPGSTSTAPVWRMTQSSSPYDGVYYVQGADAVVGGNGGSSGGAAWNATVIAEAVAGAAASNPESCDKRGGNIEWKLENVRNKMSGMVFYAEGDLIGSANSHAENGMFVAGDQVYLNTSSGSLTGAVVAADQCPDPADPNSIQGFTIEFDGTLEAPLTSVIRTTLWLEYVG